MHVYHLMRSQCQLPIILHFSPFQSSLFINVLFTVNLEFKYKSKEDIFNLYFWFYVYAFIGVIPRAHIKSSSCILLVLVLFVKLYMYEQQPMGTTLTIKLRLGMTYKRLSISQWWLRYINDWFVYQWTKFVMFRNVNIIFL